MNGNIFIGELSKQVLALNYMGDTCTAWGVTYKMYNDAESNLLDFIKRNRLNLRECVECIYKPNNNWTSSDSIVSDFIELVGVGDYIEAEKLLTKNHTFWKYRHELEKITFTLF